MCAYLKPPCESTAASARQLRGPHLGSVSSLILRGDLDCRRHKSATSGPGETPWCPPLSSLAFICPPLPSVRPSSPNGDGKYSRTRPFYEDVSSFHFCRWENQRRVGLWNAGKIVQGAIHHDAVKARGGKYDVKGHRRRKERKKRKEKGGENRG